MWGEAEFTLSAQLSELRHQFLPAFGLRSRLGLELMLPVLQGLQSANYRLSLYNEPIFIMNPYVYMSHPGSVSLEDPE